MELRHCKASLPTHLGRFAIHAFEDQDQKECTVALVMGEVEGKENVLVRLHSQCLTGDVFGSLRCDCRGQLEYSLQLIANEGQGVVVYLPQEGRGIGLYNKITAYQLQETEQINTFEANQRLGFAADYREYGTAADVIKSLGIKTVKLMTNNPAKIQALIDSGIDVASRCPVVSVETPHNVRYLQAIRDVMGHLTPHEMK